MSNKQSGPAKGWSKVVTWPPPATPWPTPTGRDWIACPRWMSTPPRRSGALAFVRRVGIEPMGQWLEAYRWLTDALRGETAAASAGAVPIDRVRRQPGSALLWTSQPRDRRRHL